MLWKKQTKSKSFYEFKTWRGGEGCYWGRNLWNSLSTDREALILLPATVFDETHSSTPVGDVLAYLRCFQGLEMPHEAHRRPVLLNQQLEAKDYKLGSSWQCHEQQNTPQGCSSYMQQGRNIKTLNSDLCSSNALSTVFILLLNKDKWKTYSLPILRTWYFATSLAYDNVHVPGRKGPASV